MIMNWPVTKINHNVKTMKKQGPIVNQIFVTNYNECHR